MVVGPLDVLYYIDNFSTNSKIILFVDKNWKILLGRFGDERNSGIFLVNSKFFNVSHVIDY
jgi:hypothetical protein